MSGIFASKDSGNPDSDIQQLGNHDSDIKGMTSWPVTEVSSSEEEKADVIAYTIEEPDNKNGPQYMGKYRRTFLSRHIQIVTLGCNIGSGLFISTGKALRNAGPGNMIIGYTLVMTMVCSPPYTLIQLAASGLTIEL